MRWDGGVGPRPIRRLEVLADGTVQQQSAITGTVVWTVPGRANRPTPSALPAPRPLPAEGREAVCAFCPARYRETPPEKARLLLDPTGPAGVPPWQVLRDLPAEALDSTVADFRRIPNLFEILPLEYWQANHGYVVPDEAQARAADYLSSAVGREHVLAIKRARLRAGGATAEEAAAIPDQVLLERAISLFAGGHDVIVARRHHVDGATADNELCSSGDLTPDEHAAFLTFTVGALHELATSSRFVRYVSVFQNWLRPAGASFDHLHKQLVAIDELGPLMDRIELMLEEEPELFGTALADPAAHDRLVIAENAHAIALAGVGHRYPTIEILSTAQANRPWEHDTGQLRGISDLLHACHAGTGRLVPTNEEWHYRPVGSEHPMPWRILLKWRVSTLAGFEGGTKINVNTISPFMLRDRMVAYLTELRERGRIGAVRIGDECSHRLGALSYTDT